MHHPFVVATMVAAFALVPGSSWTAQGFKASEPNSGSHLRPAGSRLTAEGILHPNAGSARPEGSLLRRLDECDVNGPCPGLTSTGAGGALGGDVFMEYARSLDLSSFERIAMTCNGNVGVIFSSYYLAPVCVANNLFEKVPVQDNSSSATSSHDSKPTALAAWDRETTLSVGGSAFCRATCKTRIYSEDVARYVADHEEGFSVGNLLRCERLQPKARLHEAGRSASGALWRYYTMDCPGVVEFDILEEFTQREICSLHIEPCEDGPDGFNSGYHSSIAWDTA